MITFQENTHFSQALPCTREEFWEQVRKTSTGWKIDARRAILTAVEASKTEGIAAIQNWLNNADYQKFLLKKQNMKKKAAKDAWAAKSDADKLLAFAQEIKENLPAFIFSCREFDKTETGKGNPFSHRKLAECHLNGLFLLDIDHVENPMEIWWKLRDDEELMKRIALVHLTSSGFGARIVAVADINLGNLADNQIVLAEKLGFKADESCIDATRISFAPKEEDILYINEEILFNYYNEEFDNKYTKLYREKKTQPLYHEFPSSGEKSGGDCLLGSGPQAKGSSKNPCQDLEWRGYRVQGIIDQRYAGKLPCQADSNRHNESLKLATDLLLMLDGDKKLVQQIVEGQSWVQEIIAERDENVEQTVESAAECVKQKEKKYASSQPSKAMLEAIQAFTGKSFREIVLGAERVNELEGNYSNRMNKMLEGWGREIEELFPYFPMLKDVCAGLKRSQYPAALFVAGGAAMTLMTRTWYRFYHRPQQERRLNCSLFIIGHPASNKSMADDIFDIGSG